MRLLTDPWIPVRPAQGNGFQQITLQQLLCESAPRQLCLPRDDMELAACQLLISLVQILWPPNDAKHFIQRLRQPLAPEEFSAGIAGYEDDFDLAHPHHPFMQVRDVAAKVVTGMDKLMVGLTRSTNCAFVNQPGQGKALCGGCTAIALFNQAGNAPGFGGGFKSGLRGDTPVATLIQQPCLRTTLWANTLTRQALNEHYPDWQNQLHDFTWRNPIVSNHNTISLARGLFWQPAHIELLPPDSGGQCSGCGTQVSQLYRGFLKAQFNFTQSDIWLHPHSPRIRLLKKGQIETRYLAFTTEAPCWTQLSRLLIASQVDKKQEGRSPALVVQQARQITAGSRLYLTVGGYRNNKASILARCHDSMVFGQGWEQHPEVVNEIVRTGDNYRLALRKALYAFAEGVKEKGISGAGVQLQNKASQRYYRQSYLIITPLFATIDYAHPLPELERLHRQLFTLSRQLFDDMTEPYISHPKRVLTLAYARRVLNKHLSQLQPQGEQDDGITH